jgi:DNA topoisomerase-1
MSKKLVIVESPGKIKKISSYLGDDYIVKASFGHCIDLDPKTLSIDVDNNYAPLYITISGKEKILKELKDLAKECSTVILAADEDREGEAIASSLATALKLKDPQRIVFHEITKKAITEAVNNPREINYNMVYAQQTRRLLDRLVGYKISPLLWKDNNGQSAGRVQSVVVKIIKDKEDEIINSANNPYFKTKLVTDQVAATLNKNLNYDDNQNILQNINKKSIFKVIDVDNKIAKRKPSPPFITSTLQQEASTKLGFNVKRTMDVAQKLYEAGLITYMRTDSTNLSQDAIKEATKYILDTYGKDYSNPTNYTSKSGSQEAHEAIRPTNVSMKDCNESGDNLKLYNIIWKRTIASQMANAKLNIQTIKIDCLTHDETILKGALFVSIYESIIFDGFLLVYNNKEEESDSEKQSGKCEIKVNDILNFKKITVTEEYTKSPLRYNEANLIKYLEKNNIGRPSTYASIINKIIDRKYVEIKDVDGVKKSSKQIELNSKFKIKETNNEITIGKENKKLVPTELGISTNAFMTTNFDPIMQIKFTAEFEEYLDQVALGKARWYNILDIFYKKFNPIVEKLVLIKKEAILDNLLGLHPKTKQEIYVGTGKYGPYIKILDNDKWKYYPVDGIDVTLDEAIEKMLYPKELGKYDKKMIFLCKGKFGLYLKYEDKNISVKEEVSFEQAKGMIDSGDKYALKTFKLEKKIINIKSGQYGPYMQVINGKTKKNIPFKDKNIDIKNITLKDIINLL